MPRKQKRDPEKYCERCGVRLYRKRSSIGRLEDMTSFLKRKYCSLHCANLRGIKSKKSSPQHRISQQFVKKRCEHCGGTKNLHVHHVNGDWMDHREENLKTLCIKCHLHKEHKKEAGVCSVCGKRSRKRGMCQKHYQRWRKHGDPLLTKKVGGKNCPIVRVGAMD